MHTAPIAVYRSLRASDCEEHAFVLTAVGVPHTIAFDGTGYALLVDEALAEQAHAHLIRYEAERRPAPPPPPPRSGHPYAWIGCVIYVAVLVGVAYAVGNGVWRLDAFDVGELDAARAQSGQWWRAWTALTLHVDAGHLTANVGAGVWFGYLAGRQLGSGAAWLLTVLGAGTANLLEALLGPATHRAVGASTAVFTALGVLAAHSWRERFDLPQRWALRWGPLVVGVVMLGWFGSEGENTDVVAHATGFTIGVILGATAATPLGRRTLNRVPQWLAGLGALTVIAIAWTCALRS